VSAEAWRPTGPAAALASPPSLNWLESRLFHAVLVHDKHDDIGGLASDLEAETAAANGEESGSAPALLVRQLATPLP